MQTANILGADNVPGVAAGNYYCTDGTFQATDAKAVKIQSDKHKTTGINGCSECVVDCSNFNKGTADTFIIIKDNGTTATARWELDKKVKSSGP